MENKMKNNSKAEDNDKDGPECTTKVECIDGPECTTKVECIDGPECTNVQNPQDIKDNLDVEYKKIMVLNNDTDIMKILGKKISIQQNTVDLNIMLCCDKSKFPTMLCSNGVTRVDPFGTMSNETYQIISNYIHSKYDKTYENILIMTDDIYNKVYKNVCKRDDEYIIAMLNHWESAYEGTGYITLLISNYGTIIKYIDFKGNGAPDKHTISMSKLGHTKLNPAQIDAVLKVCNIHGTKSYNISLDWHPGKHYIGTNNENISINSDNIRIEIEKIRGTPVSVNCENKEEPNNLLKQ